ncbi:F-BAR domain-containing protein [Entamoeba marina]
MSSQEQSPLTYECETIIKRLDYLLHLTKAYVHLFNQRGTAELEYGKKLLIQSTAPLKTGILLTKKRTEKHTDIGNTVIEQIAKPLENLQHTLETNKKRLASEFNSKNKQHQNLIKAAEKAGNAYQRAVQELKDVSEQLTSAMSTNVAQVDKLVSKKSQCVGKAQQLEGTYKEAVSKANEFNEEMHAEPIQNIITSSLELIQTHFDSFKNILKIIATQVAEVVPVIEEVQKMTLMHLLKKNSNVHSSIVLEVVLDNFLQETIDQEPTIVTNVNEEKENIEETNEEVKTNDNIEEHIESDKPIEDEFAEVEEVN